MKLTKVILAILVLPLTQSVADLALGSGDTYTLNMSDLSSWVISASPDLPSSQYFSFTFQFSSDLYDSESDDIRIHLYESSDDEIPFLSLFEPAQLVDTLNLTVTPSIISKLTYFRTVERIDLEVLSGSVLVDHVYLGRGENHVGFATNIDAIPEPNSVALLIIGGAGVFYTRRRKQNKTIRLG
jgi:hypothetical protein